MNIKHLLGLALLPVLFAQGENEGIVNKKNDLTGNQGNGKLANGRVEKRAPTREEMINKARDALTGRKLRRKIAWEKAVELTFDEPSTISALVVIEGKWEISAGKLCALDGKKNRSILITPISSSFNALKIEFDVLCRPNDQGLVGDVSVLINTVSPQTSKDWGQIWNGGYSLTTASYWNNETTFYKNGLAWARTEFSPVKPNQNHHITVEVDNGHISYWVDDLIVLEGWDSAPLRLEAGRWVGLRTYGTRIEIDNFALFGEAVR